MLTEEGGRFFEVGDYPGMAAACLELLEDDAACDRLNEVGQQQLTRLTLEKFREELLEAYRGEA